MHSEGFGITFLYTSFYIFSDLILPLYNKTLFSILRISKEKDALSYPTSITFIQVAAVSATVIIAYILYKLLKFIIVDYIGSWLSTIGRQRGISWFKNLDFINNEYRENQISRNPRHSQTSTLSHLTHRTRNSYDDIEDLLESKISPTRLFFMKIKELFLVSFAFSCVITLSNLGLSKTGLNIHLLLRTTSIFWVILLSFFIKKERPTLFQIVFAAFVVSGATVISMDNAIDAWKVNKDQVIGIFINLLSAFCSGLQAVTLRSAIRKVKLPPYNMSVLEITTFKLAISSFIIFIPAVMLDVVIARPMIFQVFMNSIHIAIPFVIGGVIVTAMYQGAVVAVTSRMQALTVSLLHQMILLPQLILFTLLDFTQILPKEAKIEIFKYSVPGIVGAILIVIGVIGYTGYRWYCDWKNRRNEELNKVSSESYPILSDFRIQK